MDEVISVADLIEYVFVGVFLSGRKTGEGIIQKLIH